MSENIQSYRDLVVWQKSKRYAVRVYKITEKFPSHEMYGLTSQMRRAGISIPSDIAEGFRRKSKKEKAQFLRMAYGSGAELETQLEISHDLEYLTQVEYEELMRELEEVMKMLNKNIQVFEE